MHSSACAHVLRDDKTVWDIMAEDETYTVVVGLEFERHNPYSPWRTYLDFMRRQESPIWWDDAELDELQSPQLKKETKTVQGQIKAYYDRVYPYLIKTYPNMWKADVNDLDSFTWAALTIWGRAFNVAHWNSSDTEYALIPIGDLLNHRLGRRASWSMEYNDRTDSKEPTMFAFEANEDLKKGDELTISYGDFRSSFNFVLYCGFIPQGQHYGDYVGLRVDNEVYGFIGWDGRPSSRFIRKLAAHLAERDEPVGQEDAHKDKGKEQSASSHDQALRLLLPHIKKLVSSQKPPWQADQASLDKYTDDLGYNEWVKLTVRTRFKSILHRLMENIEAKIKPSGAWAYPAAPTHDTIAGKLDKKRAADKIEAFDGALCSFDIAILPPAGAAGA